ncbi:MAG TPA: protein kinase [Kofleriaceae bacterium]|nr:protein kinase [Kofleriaceae bacterium]
MLGEIIGSYRVVRKIGEGGMGAVYLAEHMLLGRPAALKVLLREMSHREDLVTRFFNEARAATSVKHPGIVEIYDFGYHTNGSAYIVMEFLEGESLSSRLRRAGVLSEARAVALCRQVGGALAAAHAKGIVHRDLKPDNIYIIRDPDIADGERTKVLDFGIAKLTSDQPGQVSMTRTGMVMGTPAYMAPEQCKGAGHVDQRSDLYALGCILFELVCGRPPFVAEGAGEVMAHHICTPVPAPSALAPVTPLLEQIILRALAKEPEHRFATAEQMIAALAAVVPSGSYARVGPHEATVLAGHVPLGTNPPMPRSLPPAPSVPGHLYATPVPPPPSQTTMSAAAGVAMTAPAPTARRSRVVPLAALAVLVAGGGALAIVRGKTANDAPVPAARPPATPSEPTPGRDAPAKPPAAGSATGPSEPAPPSASAPPSSVPPTAPPASAPPPASEPAKVTLTIASDPPGAEVYRMPQSVRIGTTPMTYSADPVSGELVLLVKKRGYRDQTVAMPADHDGAQTVTLVKKPVPGPARPPGAEPPAPDDFMTRTPAPPSGSLDPFARPKK